MTSQNRIYSSSKVKQPFTKITYVQNQLTMSSVTQEFASAKTNATEKYGEDLEKMKVNGLGKWKLGQGRNYGTD